MTACEHCGGGNVRLYSYMFSIARGPSAFEIVLYWAFKKAVSGRCQDCPPDDILSQRLVRVDVSQCQIVHHLNSVELCSANHVTARRSVGSGPRPTPWSSARSPSFST